VITPTNWLPLITLASTTIREAWSEIITNYQTFTTDVDMGEKSVYEDAWIGRMPKMRLWSGPRVYQEPAPQTYTAVPEPFEITYTLDRFRYDDDSFGVFYPLLLDLALQTKRWPQFQLRDLLEASGAWSSTQVQLGLDGLAFWNTAHPTNIYSTQALSLATGTSYCNDFTGGGVSINSVTVGGAFSQTAVLTMIEYAATIRAEDGERLGITPTHLMHPPSLKGEVEYVLKNMLAAASVGYSTWGAAQTQVGATDNVVARMGVEPLQNHDLASFTKWYLQDNSKAVKSMRWLKREEPRITPRVSEDDPRVFDWHQYTWGGWARGAPIWSPSWLLFRSGP
jgi:phage major head subunit gpT-like protein